VLILRFKTKRSYTNDPRLPSTAERHFWGFIFGTLSDIHTLPAIGLVSALSRIYDHCDPTLYRHAQSRVISNISVFDNGSNDKSSKSPQLPNVILTLATQIERTLGGASLPVCLRRFMSRSAPSDRDMRTHLLMRGINRLRAGSQFLGRF
jgi:hypothetical protein